MPNSIHPDVRIGHVHLKVADLDRALRFYRDVLGFELTQRYGKKAAFLAAGGYPHHIGLNTWEGEGRFAAPAALYRVVSSRDRISDAHPVGGCVKTTYACRHSAGGCL